ncbi:MAG: bifunctional adenosylcobinamide kinase/adenosylcobinamide-phosphate guanylyltransferase [Nitrospirota bacterium]
MSIKRLKAKGERRKANKENSESQTPNSELIFILGGARSGKSGFALKLAESIKGKRLYIATAEALDDEMAKRIKKHKKERGDNWNTIEEPIKIVEVIKKNNPPLPPFTKGGKGGFNVILLDCLTLWISNLMHREARSKGQVARGGRTLQKITDLISACKKAKASIIIVSNEVGLGIVPDNPLARQFRDIAGFANQEIAEAADEVYFMVSGIPLKIK